MDGHVGVVTRHNHLGALGELNSASHVRGAEVELGAVVREERLVTATLILLQNVDLALEVGVRGGGTGLAEDHAANDILLLGATEQNTDVLTSATLVEDLAEHLDAGDGGLLNLVVDTDDLDLLAGLDDAALNTTGDNGATTGDGEDVLNRHEEGLVEVTLRLRDVLIHGVHEVEDRLSPLLVTLKGLEGGDANDRAVVAVEVLRGQQLANLHLDELDELLVVDHVALVEGDDDGRHAHLAGEQDVLTSLGHRAVGGGDHEDGAVHLGSTSDHVLDVVSVTGAVNVSVVTILGLVLDVSDRDRDAALTLLGSLVDLVERRLLVQLRVLVVQHLGDRRGEGRLAVVDVSDGADVAVRLGPLELGLCHWGSFWNVARLCTGRVMWIFLGGSQERFWTGPRPEVRELVLLFCSSP